MLVNFERFLFLFLHSLLFFFFYFITRCVLRSFKDFCGPVTPDMRICLNWYIITHQFTLLPFFIKVVPRANVFAKLDDWMKKILRWRFSYASGSILARSFFTQIFCLLLSKHQWRVLNLWSFFTWTLNSQFRPRDCFSFSLLSVLARWLQ